MINKLKKYHPDFPTGAPMYNVKSISIIERYGKENSYNFQHAENGGEVQVIGYFVDGYDKERNVVIEYYEKHHKYQTFAKASLA